MIALVGSTKIRMEEKQEAHLFKETRQNELKGLIENGTFKIIKRNTVPKEKRMYGTRFVDTFKTVGGIETPKSRLVAQIYMDHDAARVPTKTPTVQRSSQGIICSTGA